MNRVWALLRFCAGLAPIGLLGHLVADAFDAPGASVRLFTGMHAVLAVIALVGCAFVCAWCYRTRGDAKRRVALFFHELPGRGGVVTATAAAAMLAVFIAVTQSFEGALAAVSLVQALLVATLVSALAITIVAAVRGRLEFSTEAAHLVRELAAMLLLRRDGFARPYFAVVAVRGNRPPPATP